MIELQVRKTLNGHLVEFTIGKGTFKTMTFVSKGSLKNAETYKKDLEIALESVGIGEMINYWDCIHQDCDTTYDEDGGSEMDYKCSNRKSCGVCDLDNKWHGKKDYCSIANKSWEANKKDK